jgi:hypothetical protein
MKSLFTFIASFFALIPLLIYAWFPEDKKKITGA